MSSTTGIELGPSSCVLVGARLSSHGTGVSAVHTIPASEAATGAALASAVHAARDRYHFPRTARVVAWDLPKSTAPDDLAARLLLKPLTAAGFRIEALLTPAEALARLALTRTRSNGSAVAWVSINVHGGAMAIVRSGEVLYSRTLNWNYNPKTATVREQLLQRYLLVSHIAPELQRGLAMVRSRHGLKVETVVTCGDLPDLRSLTMPLIEELDLEVETLDSTEGLLAKGALAPERLEEAAPTIRLAAAAATMPIDRPRSFGYPAAIAGGLFLGLAMLWLALLLRPAPIPSPSPVPTAVDKRVTEQKAPAVPERPPVDAPAPAASSGSSGATAPVSGLGSPTQSITSGRQPLPPVPPLTSILIDGGRRLAMFGGEIVGVGDQVGPRLVIRIESNAVVLQEPSGTQIRVLIRPGQSDGLKSGSSPGHGRSPRTPAISAR